MVGARPHFRALFGSGAVRLKAKQGEAKPFFVWIAAIITALHTKNVGCASGPAHLTDAGAGPGWGGAMMGIHPSQVNRYGAVLSL